MTASTPAEIAVEELLPHSPALVWRALTSGALIARWMGMAPNGFAPVAGTRFAFRTDPAGAWDGRIDCEVLVVEPERRLHYAWRSGDAANVGYGAPLDSLVAFTLTPVVEGTHLRIVHAGFRLPRNAVAYDNMSAGWARCAANLRAIANDP